MGGATALRFNILGPLEARRLGDPVDLGGAKQRALLAVLLLNANKVVPVERLIDDLWGEEPPETAANTLQVYVSQLRKLLEPGVSADERMLRTQPPGYTAAISDGQLDLTTFERLLVEGREAMLADELELAATQLREALSLWRGPCLVGLPIHGAAEAAIARLEELRLAVSEDLVVVELGLGRHAELVPELETLIVEHPYRESLRGHLMLALYRSGRQADALNAFRDAREILVEELGIDPSRELQRLEQAILQHDPALDLVPRPSRSAEETRRRRAVAAAARGEAERRRTVAVAVVEVLIGSDDGDELDPELVSGVASRAFEVLAAGVERHHGIVYRALGTRVVAVFGAAAVHEDDTLRAARAILDASSGLTALALELERELGVHLTFQAGIESGTALVGRDDADELVVTGNVLASAEHVCASAAAGEVLIGSAAQSLLAGASEAEERAPSGGRPLWRLLEVDREASSVRRHDASLVGREDEVAALRRAVARAAKERRAVLVTVLGEAGIGKSRLALEMRRQKDPEVRMLWGACRSYGEGVTFSPVADVVAELVADEDPEAAIAALLGDDPEAETIASVVAGAIGAGEAVGATEDVFRAVRRLLQVEARERPLLVVFDDLHWAEPTFLDLIEHVAEWSQEAPIVLLCLARPELLEERPSWGSGADGAVTLTLEPLSEVDSKALIDEFLGDQELASETRDRIASFGGGNPFFVEQLLALAAQEPQFAAQLSSPPTVEALLSARLDRLASEERTVLEHASVVGAEFALDAVSALLSEEVRESAARALDRLAGKRLVRPVEEMMRHSERYAFTHVLIRETAYQSLPKRRRAALHAQLAEWFVDTSPNGAPELDEVAGYHLEQAYLYRRQLGQTGEAERALAEQGAERLAAAGRRAYAFGDIPAAVTLLTRATRLLAPDHPARPETLAELGEALRDAGELDLAESTLSEAIEAATRSGDAAAEARAVAVRWQVRLQIDPDVSFDEAADAIGATIDRLMELGHERGLAKAWVSLAEVPWLRGQAEASEHALERGLAYARSSGDTRTEALALNSLVGVAMTGPMPVKAAIERCNEVLEETRAEGRVAASALRALAGLHAMEGRFDEAWAFMERDRALLRELGLKVVASSSAGVAGWIGLLAGDPVRAEAELRWGYQILDEIGDRNGLATVAAILAEATVAQGQDDETLALTELSSEAGAPEDMAIQVQWRGPRAKALARRGEVEAAEQLAQEAVALAERSDFLDLRGNALMDLSEVLWLRSRPADAAAAAESALALYRRKGNRVSAARARAAVKRASLAPT
ncbi:MAG TPA: BTAD domain-containing putative transcriptional regulator [Gaiellaceae bacterium]